MYVVYSAYLAYGAKLRVSYLRYVKKKPHTQLFLWSTIRDANYNIVVFDYCS